MADDLTLTNIRTEQIELIKELRKLEQTKTPTLLILFGFLLAVIALAIRIWRPGCTAYTDITSEFLVIFFSGIGMCITGALVRMYRYNKMVITMARDHQRLGAEMLRQMMNIATLMERQKTAEKKDVSK